MKIDKTPPEPTDSIERPYGTLRYAMDDKRIFLCETVVTDARLVEELTAIARGMGLPVWALAKTKAQAQFLQDNGFLPVEQVAKTGLAMLWRARDPLF